MALIRVTPLVAGESVGGDLYENVAHALPRSEVERQRAALLPRPVVS